jgi:hypothetical protein
MPCWGKLLIELNQEFSQAPEEPPVLKYFFPKSAWFAGAKQTRRHYYRLVPETNCLLHYCFQGLL